MRGRPRSVDRGTCRPGSEPRKTTPPGRRRRGRKRKATSGVSRMQDTKESRAVRDPEHVRTHLGDARPRAVGQPRNTCEVSEQRWATSGGGDGGKGAGQGELGPAKRAPD